MTAHDPRLDALTAEAAAEARPQTEEAERRWTSHVVDMYSAMLMRKAKSWFTGYNSNVAGHEEGKIRYMVYNGGMPKYLKTIAMVADSGYDGVTLSRHGVAPVSGTRDTAPTTTP